MPRDFISLSEINKSASVEEGYRRFLVLADFLETRVPPEKFGMWSFNSCAGYWATQIPELQALGLSRTGFRNRSAFGKRGVFAYLDDFFAQPSFTWANRKIPRFNWAPSYFEGYKNTPTDTARRIRDIIAERRRMSI